ncbi:MAG: sugar ABC transporter permease [Actinomycetes bacterium]
MTTETAASQSAPEDTNPDNDLRDAWTEYWAKIRGGDVGALPAVLGLVALVLVFSLLRSSTFPTVFNFANLLNQSAGVIVLAMGLVFVLLLGEIDLSVGFAAGTCAAVLGVTLTLHNWPWELALAASILTGMAIGLTIGLLVALLRIPSFVVTLAFFLGLQGVMLLVIGEGGTIGISNDQILAINNNNLSPALSWVLYLIVVLGYGFVTFRRISTRRKSGLPAETLTLWGVKLGALAVILGVTTFLLNNERSRNPAAASIKGVPVVVPVILLLLVVLTFLLSRTGLGRHIYAVGGNAEAARRAGINVAGVRIFCFVLCSTMAAVGGILIASRDNSISPSTGGSITTLSAVAAAVIGGTSLFGGRGKVRDAILGGLVLGVINNALPLITQTSGAVFIVTGLVLLFAASVDAISRRRAAATGRG